MSRAQSMEPGGREPAPGELRTVQLFINSQDIEGGTDEFATPAALSAWLRAHRLTRSRLRLNRADAKKAIDFRELLRGMVLANNGRPLAPTTLEEVNTRLQTLPLVARFDGPGALRLDTAAGGLDGALGHIVAIVAAEVLRGRWHRMKACARDACHWVFYDQSRNRTGTWCSMSICGARTKVGAYYWRHRKADGKRASGIRGRRPSRRADGRT